MKIKLLFIFLTNIIFATLSLAQIIPNSATLKTSPVNITSNQDFEIYVESYNFKTDKANYVWKVNNKVVASGEGLKSINLKTQDGGLALNIVVTITTVEGRTFSVSSVVNPGEINLIWESIDGYTPDWYQGKTLNTFGGGVRVVAFPQIIEKGVAQDPSSLVYRWFVNEKFQDKSSGLGRRSLSYTGTEEELDRLTIRVEIESKNSEYVYGKSLKIPFVDPQIHIYEKNSIFGILNNFSLAGVVQFANSDINLVAEPFYFSSKNRNLFTYSWEINDQTAFGQSNAERFIKTPTDKNGLSKINLKIINKDKLLQESSKGFVIKF